MKKLLMVGLMMVVLGITAQANAYVLVYNLFGMVQAVDTAANGQVTQLLSGYIVLNINETDGTVDDSSIILYGRQGWRSRFYTVADDIVNFTTYGNFVTLIADNGQGDRIILTGRLRGANIGASARQRVADPLSGAMTLQNGQLFDANASLTGAGAMQANLNTWLTRNANSSATAFGDVVNSIISNLESRGFQPVEESEPPVPSDGNEPAPT
ncbi:MAG: hypothetical protein ABSH16_11710 [Sedimentisphaerales bacterium]